MKIKLKSRLGRTVFEPFFGGFRSLVDLSSLIKSKLDLSKRTINKLPLDSLWTEKEEFDAKRGKYLRQVEIADLLRKGPIQFVIANLGDKPVWKEVEDSYKIYKAELKHHIIDDFDHIDLEHFKGNFGYLASLWDGNFKAPLVLLEKIH